MKYFWLKFGRADAHSLVEARHAAVSYARNFLFLLLLSFVHFYLPPSCFKQD